MASDRPQRTSTAAFADPSCFPTNWGYPFQWPLIGHSALRHAAVPFVLRLFGAEHAAARFNGL
jgi:hypothetical protein